MAQLLAVPDAMGPVGVVTVVVPLVAAVGVVAGAEDVLVGVETPPAGEDTQRFSPPRRLPHCASRVGFQARMSEKVVPCDSAMEVHVSPSWTTYDLQVPGRHLSHIVNRLF